MVDRPSRPHRCPHRTPAPIEERLLEARRVHRRGADWIGPELGIAPSTVGRVLVRHQVAPLAECDALTGQRDVKRLGRIPDGGGWRARGRITGVNRHLRPGYDFVHSAIDDHSRLAYSEILPDERGETCAGFLGRAAAFFASMGITAIERVMSDNASTYRHSGAFAKVMADLGARHILIRPHCPWTNGKVERLNRTLLREWAYSQVFRSNAERAACLPGWLWHYNTRRCHSSLGGLPPVSRLSTTW